MKRSAWITFAAALALATAAQAQSTSITTGPGGALSGSVNMPGAPSISVQAGGGQVTTNAGPMTGRGAAESTVRPGRSYAGPGNSVTVRSPDGSASSSAWVSGPNGVVAGAGSPGSRVTMSPPPGPRAAAPKRRVCPRGASRAYRARTHCIIPSSRARAGAAASASTGGRS